LLNEVLKYDTLTGMDEGKTNFEQLLSVMPERKVLIAQGWEDKSKELGVLARGREIKNALDFYCGGTAWC
jgi:hypothetical protein